MGDDDVLKFSTPQEALNELADVVYDYEDFVSFGVMKEYDHWIVIAEIYDDDILYLHQDRGFY